jgi:hypothetical protein
MDARTRTKLCLKLAARVGCLQHPLWKQDGEMGTRTRTRLCLKLAVCVGCPQHPLWKQDGEMGTRTQTRCSILNFQQQMKYRVTLVDGLAVVESADDPEAGMASFGDVDR